VLRAAVQLLIAGYVLALIFYSQFWPWFWIAGMVGYYAQVVRNRTAGSRQVFVTALLAIGGSTGLSLVLVFLLNILDFSPITLIVIAGITMETRCRLLSW